LLRGDSFERPSPEELMQRLQVAAGILSVLALTGCPSEFGKEGRIAKAVHKDAQEQFSIERCSDAYEQEVCDGPNKDSEECRKCRQ
jgi:hypothetical protein